MCLRFLKKSVLKLLDCTVCVRVLNTSPVLGSSWHLNPFVIEVLIFVSAWKLSLQSLFGGVPLTFQSMLKNLEDYQYFLAQVFQVNYTTDISDPSVLFERQSPRPLTSVLTKLTFQQLRYVSTTLSHWARRDFRRKLEPNTFQMPSKLKVPVRLCKKVLHCAGNGKFHT